MSRCLIDAYNCNDDCNKCEHYDHWSNVEMTLYNSETDRSMKIRLRKSELEEIKKIVKIPGID